MGDSLFYFFPPQFELVAKQRKEGVSRERSGGGSAKLELKDISPGGRGGGVGGGDEARHRQTVVYEN